MPTTLADALAIPFDGSIGTGFLQNFDLYFDSGNGRMAVRHERVPPSMTGSD